MRTVFLAVTLAVPGLLSGARDDQPGAPATNSTAQSGENADSAKPGSNAEKSSTLAAVDNKSYLIGAEDVLNISVWREPELTRQVVVRPDGKITLQLINEINAAGLTPEQLADAITDGLKKYIKSPEVNVSVQQVNSKKYYIHGEVMKPGAYPLAVPTTVLEGLGNAGGFRDFANLKGIVILRGTERLKFNFKEVRSGKHLEQNILLQPGDQIFVP